MKKIIFIAICTISLLGFTSCGSTSPCGLAQKTEPTKLTPQQNVMVAHTTLQ